MKSNPYTKRITRDILDGKASIRAAEMIMQMVKENENKI